MPGYSIALVVLVGSALLAWLFMRWANKKLKRTHRKEFPAYRHGGVQAQISILFAAVATVAFVVLMSEIL